MGYGYRGNKPTPPTVAPEFGPENCGTRAGYKQHKRHRTDICQPCQDANNDYMAEYNRRRREPRTLKPCGTHAAYNRHLKHGETPCAPCTEGHRDYLRRSRKDTWGATRLVTRPLNPENCGTYKGYKAHKRRGQDACPPCATARTEYCRAQKAAKKAAA